MLLIAMENNKPRDRELGPPALLCLQEDHDKVTFEQRPK